MKPYIILFIALFTGSNLVAQTENTSEKLIDQLKNGTAQGLLFAKNEPAPAANTINPETKESLVAQIRKGIAKGMKFLPVPAIAPVNAGAAQKAVVAPTGQLASEQEIRKQESKTIITFPVIPTQEEAKKEESTGKQQ
jgi:hypothetical protein